MPNSVLNILKNNDFDRIYFELLSGNIEEQSDKLKILSSAIFLINSEDKVLQNFGYRLIVSYCNATSDFKPLYDISIRQGLFPISWGITHMGNVKDKFENSFLGLSVWSGIGNYIVNNKVYTKQQHDMTTFFEKENENSVVVIAPTSYGKTELILNLIRKNVEKNIVIIVPTKSLLSQTKKRIMESIIDYPRKIITHPEMFEKISVEKVICVLTQERLLRLLRKNPTLNFDIVVIDEAHNLLEQGERAILLATVIMILYKRNNYTAFKYLSPFLLDQTNLKIINTDYQLDVFRITEYIKTEKVYIYDFRNQKVAKYYDQFLDKFYKVNDELIHNEYELVLQKSEGKSIIYANKPIDIENIAYDLSRFLPVIEDDYIEIACHDLATHLHKDYKLIECLKHGIIYHHGSVPENIRSYIEHLYSTITGIKFVVTSSTLLEGVNIPAKDIYIFDNKKGKGQLTRSQFQNLIGRINRFGQIFGEHSIHLGGLIPRVYIVGSKYLSNRANLASFIKDTLWIEKKGKEVNKNILAVNHKLLPKERSLFHNTEVMINNLEPNIIKNNKINAKTEIGKLCFLNSINEIDIIENEESMQKRLLLLRDTNVTIIDSTKLIEIFSLLFLSFISEKAYNIKRLENDSAKKYYSMFINWRANNTSFNQMIASTIKYWERRCIETTGDVDIFVGKWGDKTRNGGFRKLWVNIREKTFTERVNLAIVRIKEEQDFIDNIFIKYIETLNDLKLLDDGLYNKIKYGTENEHKIELIKRGFSISAANLLIDNYASLISFEKDKEPKFNNEILQRIRTARENEVIAYEIEYNLISNMEQKKSG